MENPNPEFLTLIFFSGIILYIYYVILVVLKIFLLIKKRYGRMGLWKRTLDVKFLAEQEGFVLK